ncbi:MAG TPA: hypothetical protein VKJ07_07815, partial [Mycobacteriales bacterium]|nr:hypothetical protein [Mycobacteriales bacterium]
MSALSRTARTVGLAAVFGAAGLLTAAPASAATCRVVQVQNAVPVGIALNPQNTSVAYGGCVQFSDQAFGPPVTITVAGGYHVTLSYGDNTSG